MILREMYFLRTILRLLCLPLIYNVAENADLLISVDPDRQMLIDSLGRERFFHGTNVVYKDPPFHPEIEGYGPNTYWEGDMKLMQSLGLNSVRLGMMMPGFVPAQNEYNATYMDIMQTIVKKSAEYGIYILLDMHQDVFSPKFCVEGMPDWITKAEDYGAFPYPLTDQPFPIDPKTGYPQTEYCRKFLWSDYYFTHAASQAFQNLYSNKYNLLDGWADFWKNTAAAFEKVNNVIGYELINEPFCGDIYKNPKLIVPGVADRVNLEPAYDVLQRAIRSVDENHIIFFEGVTWDFFEVGFTKVPGGAKYSNRSVLSYHYYEPPDFDKKLNFLARKQDLERLRCGGFMTEFLTCENNFADMFEMMDLSDKHMQSWHGWSYKPYGVSDPNAPGFNNTKASKTGFMHKFDGSLDDILVQNTSRTYPQAVAGKTQQFQFDRESKWFMLSYITIASCKSTRTEVYFNKKLHYSNGYHLEYAPKSHLKVSESDNGFLLLIDHDADLPTGSEIYFEITAM